MSVAGLDLFMMDEGPPDGRPVLLLHGFPDSSALWRHQVPSLLDAGCRVLAPDLRGFGRSDKPAGVEHYAIGRLVSDLVGLLDAAGVERAAVVGHDWGAALGWAFAIFHEARVERFAALSVGHPSGFWTGGLEQCRKSWYMLWFLHEGVAEDGLRADDWRFFRRWLERHPDPDAVVADMARPGALTAALSWYRANINPANFAGRPAPGLPPVTCPVLAVWSDGDDYLCEEQMLASKEYVTGPFRYERLPGVGHWIPLEAPRELNPLLGEFLAERV